MKELDLHVGDVVQIRARNKAGAIGRVVGSRLVKRRNGEMDFSHTVMFSDTESMEFFSGDVVLLRSVSPHETAEVKKFEKR